MIISPSLFFSGRNDRMETAEMHKTCEISNDKLCEADFHPFFGHFWRETTGACNAYERRTPGTFGRKIALSIGLWFSLATELESES